MDYMIVPEGAIWCSRLPNAQKLHSISSSVIKCTPVSTPWQWLHLFICSHTYSALYGVVELELWGDRTEQLKKNPRICEISHVWGSVQPTGDCPQKGFLTKAHKYLPAAPKSLLCLLKENDTVLSVSWIYSSIVINIYIKSFNLPSSKLITKLQTTLLQGIFNL